MSFQKQTDRAIVNIGRVFGDVHFTESPMKLQKQLVTIPHCDLNEIFGRESDLIKIYELLQETSKVVLVNGVGGIGKTTMAKAFLQTYGNDFQHIAWIQVENDIKTSLVNNQELVYILGLEENFKELPASTKKEEGFKLIISRLRIINAPNLLIIDNAYDDIENTKTLEAISLKPNWKVLVTSRQSLEGFDNYLLAELSNEDALNLFFHHYKIENRDKNNGIILSQIFEQFEYNTLLIELFAKTGQSRRLSILEIASKINEKSLAFLGSSDQGTIIQFQRGDNEQISNVIRFLQKIFDISCLTEEERQVLANFSVMSNKPLPFSAKSDREGVDTFFQAIETEKRSQLSNTVNRLSKKGWLIWDNINDTFRMHQSIQELMWLQIKPTITNLNLLISFLSNVLAEPHLFKKKFAKSHSEIIYKNIIKLNPNDQVQELWAYFVHNLGMISKELGEYDKSEQYYNAAIKIKEKLASTNPEHNTSLAQTMNNLGSLYINSGKFSEARTILEEALKIFTTEDNGNVNLRNLCSCYDNLGIVFRHIDDLQTSKDYHSKCIILQEKIAADGNENDKQHLANMLMNFGLSNITSKDYDLSKQLFDRANNIYKELESDENKETYLFLRSRVLLNLGELYKSCNEFTKSHQYFKDCIEIRRELKKNDDSVYSKPLANSLYCFSELLYKNCNLNESISVINEALEIYDRLYRINPYSFYINVGDCLKKKSEILCALNQKNEAKLLLKKAIEIMSEYKYIEECSKLIAECESFLVELENT
ncbi:MAG: tetratricopeptide repeat protein [Candidatus Kapabacteria bacterium]|jgi:hypothetical protein|nr:tetratricopeptide repeat protein [Candidatus Kapabacteria bacterium]